MLNISFCSMRERIAWLTLLAVFVSLTPGIGLARPPSSAFKTDSELWNSSYVLAVAAATPTPDIFTVEEFQLTRGSERDLKITLAQCSPTTTFDTKDKVISQVQIDALKRSGIIISEVAPSGCDLVFNIAIEPTAQFRNKRISLQFTTNGVVSSESISIELIDEPPTPPGPIPPGMKPDVDIMWVVVPNRITKDNFGSRVAKLFYCIEVVIGNNTGYDLQIASVGFQLGPVGNAAKAMSDTYKAVADSMRNQQQQKIKEVLATSRANCSGSEAEMLKCQNETLARQLNDLNVSQTAVVTAVKDQARMLSELSRVAYSQRVPVSSYTMARGTVEHGRFLSFRNLGVNLLKSLGPVLTGFTPFFHVLNRRANYSEGINILSNPIEKGFEALVPDETIDQMQRMDDQILRDGMIIQNNRQIRTRVFIPKDLLKLEGNIRDDAMMVTQALGELYLIGDSIKFINRISVTSTGSGEIIPPPTINPTTPVVELNQSKAPQGFNLTGTNLTGAIVTSPDPNIIVDSFSSTKTSVHVELKVQDTATPGSKTLNVTTPSGTVPIVITVKLPPPTLDTATVPDDPYFVSFLPVKATSDEKTLNGDFLQGAKITAHTGNPIAATITNINSDGKSIKVRFDVPVGLDVGNYGFNITNPDNPNPVTVTLAVKKRRGPVVVVNADEEVPFESSDAQPPKRNPSTETSVTLKVPGTGLNDLHPSEPLVQTPGETPRFAISAASVNVISDKEVQVKLLVPKNTPAGRYHFMFKNNKGDMSNRFTLKVNPQDGVTIPKEEERTQTLTIADNGTGTITLNGSNLDGPRLQNVPAGWNITVSQGSNPTQLILNVKAPATFTDGPVQFKITNTDDDPAKAVDVTINVKHPAVPGPATPTPSPPSAAPPH